MLNLKALVTSLTKHGAHKVAWLLRDFDPNVVLTKLRGAVPGINIELVQARSNLSANADDTLPQVWHAAKKKGPETINALVLIAIIFSHYKLIEAMRVGAQSKFRGCITRGQTLSEKNYTNFAHTLDELGYGKNHTDQSIDFDLSRMFKMPGLNGLVLDVLALKMRAAGWDGRGDVRTVLLDNNFHEVFATSKSQFKSWLATGEVQEALEALEDADYFLDNPIANRGGRYEFRSGHKAKKTGTVTVRTPINSRSAKLIHNYIQNKLYAQLVTEHGEAHVGCEVPTGDGTLIDLVVKTKKAHHFYEIKVADTVKSCIRQAIPQLLEYGYWQDGVKPDRLFIVASHTLDVPSEAYLARLRTLFKLPLEYQQFVDS